MKADPNLLTVQEVAEKLRCSVNTVNRWRGPFRIKAGGVVRIDYARLLEYYRESAPRGKRCPPPLSLYVGPDWSGS